MKKITPQFLLVLLLSANIFAQSEKSQPQLIEEFGLIPTSHWYNFLYGVGQQYKDSESNLLIKIQGNPHKSLLYPFVFGARMKAHFVGNMKFDGEKIFVQNCDLEKGEIKVQIFQLSENSVIPKCNDEIPVPKETFLFKSRHFENPYVQYEDIYEIPGQEEGISKISYKILNELLKKTPDSRIILIGYLGTNHCSGNCLDKKGYLINYEFRKTDKPRLLKTILKNVKDEIVNSGVDASIISTISSGYQDSTRNVEIYFVPKGGEIPKPKPNYFPNKKRSKK